MGQTESTLAAPTRAATKAEPAADMGAPIEDMSLSSAILFARKFTQRHPLFAWRPDEHVLRRIGSRALKHSFLVDFTDLSGAANACVLLSLVPTQASLLCHQSAGLTTYKLKSLLVALKHPYLLPTLDVHYANEKGSSTEVMQRPGILVAQPFVSTGSLKDLVFQRADPRRAYEEKYAPRHTGAGLARPQVARYGRQILLGLDALRQKGIICEHLKLSNIILDNNVARIADIYNTVLGLERDATWRAWTVPLEGDVDVDLLLFGHCLYEMACGQALAATAPTVDDLLELPIEIADVLRVIFHGEGPDVTVHALLSLPLFASSSLNDTPLPPLRLDSHMKALLKASMRINQARRHAYRVQYEDAMALEEARRSAEASHDEKRKGHQLRSRALSKSMRRSQYRASSASLKYARTSLDDDNDDAVAP
ncbi:SLOB protein kinase [Saprolegnia diclina VS20]|uniref:SLOB protein kinase n=1 Tax=Saprolegnia diclina (strain VS20) TaxID=1156394 RepID=T0RYW4_SAPDV|nr:SLOB protein kinase [Saprolegnia diclina VS20]EQC37813.1 SLOB protein kinase [Saprolegnia diclina VS20]|eukprot:XP_008608746.1 SLOB protein kinase [Saprolegnia diclina VS20]